MISKRYRSKCVNKLIVVILIIIILTINNRYNYNVLTIIRVPTIYDNKSRDIKVIKNPPKGYLVWSDNCHIPSIDPFQSNYDFEPQIGPKCTDKEQLIVKLFNTTTKQYSIHINEHLKDQYVTKDDYLNCCYSKIIRNGDKDIKLSNCRPFQQDFIVPNHIDYMLIACKGIRNTSTVYKDGLSFIQERLNAQQKIQQNTQTQQPFGILLFGIDSVSQFNFRRVMPKTFEYVEKHNWFELSGYNKLTMTIKRYRSKCVNKLILAILIIIVLTIYNRYYYNVLTIIRVPTIYNNKSRNIEVIKNPPEGYLVWSDNCHIPSMDPFQSNYDFEPQIGPKCTDKEQLIVKFFNTTTKQYSIHINEHLKDQYVTKDDYLNCCYSKIIRNGDKDIKLSNCRPFQQDFIVPNHIDYMLIACKGIRNTSTVFKDGLSFIQERLKVQQKIQQNTQTQRPFGILLFGIDSVSQFNFRRVMPKTFEYVEKHNWFELSGYNKMDDNTFPNLMAVFTGLGPTISDKYCNYHKPSGLNDCNTLFKLFNGQGLITAFSEDECSMSTFDYFKAGFLEPPTDYYQRPLLIAAEYCLPVIQRSGLKFCMGPRKYAEYVYDFGVEFAERFLGKSIFGLFWINSISHNDWRDPNTMDQRMVDYFKEMEFKRILENSVVLLFSDHGSRYGDLRDQKEGYLEERLPMFFLYLPKWFQVKYPDFVWSLKVNKHRLTSPYDLHMTLKHLALISRGKEHEAENMDVPLSCPACQTLLKPVLENRTCKQAGINDHWCTCIPYKNIPCPDKKMENMTKLLIDEMNKYLLRSGYNKKCAPLIFKQNKEVNLKLNLHETDPKSSKQTYRVNFETLPNDAEFDATFTFDTIKKNITIDVAEISRLNTYEMDSPCINDTIAKKYCICYESIKND